MTMSKSQVERLGIRLIGSPRPAADDLAALHQLLVTYDDALAGAVTSVRDSLGAAPTSRIKSTGTILEKLHRYGGSWLKSIQDIAGMRIVGSFDRTGQDAMVSDLVALFDTGVRRPKVIDRRKEPSHGYRAVHVVAFLGSVPVEIQVRTPLQHEWADLFEKLADRIGRGIRYGEPPDHWKTVGQRENLSPAERAAYEHAYRARCDVLGGSLFLADIIHGFETAEQLHPAHPELDRVRSRLQDNLTGFRRLLALVP